MAGHSLTRGKNKREWCCGAEKVPDKTGSERDLVGSRAQDVDDRAMRVIFLGTDGAVGMANRSGLWAVLSSPDIGLLIRLGG